MKGLTRYVALLAGAGFLAGAPCEAGPLAGLASPGCFLAAALVESPLTNSWQAADPALPGLGASVLRLLGALLVVLAFFLAAAWVFRKWILLGPATRSPGKLRILEIRPMGHRHALYVVGYEQQRLLLSCSPSGVTFLSSLPPSDTPEAPVAPVPPSFLDAFRQVIGRSS